MKTLMIILFGSIGSLTSIYATTPTSYQLSCRVSMAAEASVALESDYDTVSINGEIQVELLNRFAEIIQTKTMTIDATNLPTHITRLSRFDVPWEVSQCRASILRARLTINGYSEYIEPNRPVVVEHRHYHLQPSPVITREVHHYHTNSVGLSERRSNQIVIIERERKPRHRRVEKTIIRREEERPKRSETRVQIELPVIRAQL